MNLGGIIAQLVLLIILGIATNRVDANLVVNTVNGTSFNLRSIQIIYKDNPSLPLAENITARATNDENDVIDAILVVRSSLPVEQRVASAEQKGAKAVINITPVYYEPGFLSYRMNDKALGARLQLPIFEVAVEDGRKLWPLVLNNEIVNITIMPDETANPWEVVLDSPWNYAWVGKSSVNYYHQASRANSTPRTVSLCVFAATNVALCIWKLVLFTRFYGGAKNTIAIYVLVLELISNLLRVVASIDSFGATGVYPEWANIAFIEQSFPFALSSFMLFTLYWHEMMTNASLIVHPFITKMRIPFFVSCCGLVSIQVIRTIVRNTTNTEVNLSIMTSIIYLIAAVGLVIFYAITGGKLLKRLYERKKIGRAANLKKSTTRILVSGGFIFTFVLVAILFVTGWPYRPVPFVVIWWVFIVTLNSASMMNILAFQLPVKASSTSKCSDTRSEETHSYRTSVGPATLNSVA